MLLPYHGSADSQAALQIMLAVLARGYDWELDLNEPVKTFPLPVFTRGMPMTFQRLQRPVTASEE